MCDSVYRTLIPVEQLELSIKVVDEERASLLMAGALRIQILE